MDRILGVLHASSMRARSAPHTAPPPTTPVREDAPIRHGDAVRVLSLSASASSGVGNGPTQTMTPTDEADGTAVDRPTRSPSESSGSSVSRASSNSNRSTVSSVRSSGSSSGTKRDRTEPHRRNDAMPHKKHRKRPRSDHTGPLDRVYTKQQRQNTARATDDEEDVVDEGHGEGLDARDAPQHGWTQSAPAPSPSPSVARGDALARASRPQQPVARSQLARRQPQPKPQLMARMAEHLFQHSTALLHHATLENDVRTDDIHDEIRSAKERQEHYDRKLRSLQRELAALHAGAAAAYARGESMEQYRRAQRETSSHTRVQPEPSTDAASPRVDMLIPVRVPEREASIRAEHQECRDRTAPFSDELRGLDEYAFINKP